MASTDDVSARREPDSSDGRDESELERTDRNLGELMQELRVAQTGVQMMFAFLLVVPFSARFGEVTAFQRTLYFAALLLAGGSAVLLIAPAAQHRLLFRRDHKRHILFAANRFAIAGLTTLGASMVVSLALISDVLYGSAVTIAVTLVTAGALAVFWYGQPLWHGRDDDD